MPERTQVFISYSSSDREWLTRVRTHLSVLERRQLIDVWSDANIEIGFVWQQEIEAALSKARIAVLLISPAFLASKYVWEMEMPRIIEHSKKGMDILPLILRPCAWQLETDLARLQARPELGRALSSGNDYQIDLDLSLFTYELAAKIGSMETAQAIEAKELLQAHGGLAGEAQTRRRPFQQLVGDRASLEPLSILLGGTHPLVWSGEYAPTQTRLRFTIESAVIDQIKGAIEYVGDGTITDVEGSFAETPEELSTDGLWPDRKDWPKSARRVALRFREVSTRTRGGREPGLNGEYRAIASPSDLVAVWVSEAQVVSLFSMCADFNS